jgi:peptide/nickel transport system substrate-binding protein
MVESWKVGDDKLTWTFTLRDGLKFHDGAAGDVRGLHRLDQALGFARRDGSEAYGQFTKALAAVDDKTFTLTLKPYGLVLNRSASPARTCRSSCPSASPRRRATTQIKEFVGSGPFVFKRRPVEARREDGLRQVQGLQAARRAALRSRRAARWPGRPGRVDRHPDRRPR